MEPKISVIIPMYNNERSINSAIDSVFSQQISNIELIIVDDGSDDDVEPKIRCNWPDKQIFFIKQSNEGPAAARNKGIQNATGDFITFLDADDEWLPEHLAKCLNFIEKRKFDWVATAYLSKSPDGAFDYRTFSDDSFMYDRLSGKVTLLKQGLFWFSSVPITTNTLMFRTACIRQLVGFDPLFRIGEDTDLYLRAEEAGFTCGFLDEATAIYNYNPTSITKINKYDPLLEHLRVAKKHANILGLDNVLIRMSYADFIWHAARNYSISGEYIKAVKYGFTSMCVYFDFAKIQSLINTRLNHFNWL